MKKLILGIFLAVWWCGNHACAQDIAAKTNLLYWATTTPNIGMEFGLVWAPDSDVQKDIAGIAA